MPPRNSNAFRVAGRLLLLLLFLLITSRRAFAGDSATLLSETITNGTSVAPRSIFTQTWTFQNTGTTTWSAGGSGYTLDMIGLDSLGAIPLITNTQSEDNGTYTYHFPRAAINGSTSVGPNGTAAYSLEFIAPEAQGQYTDTFQLNGSGFFGPTVTVQVAVSPGGNTNVFDRSRAISFANNYADYFCPDGYFWTNGSDYAITNKDIFALAPTGAPLDDGVGDDCAHFVSYCIGSGPYVRGAGMVLPSRATPTYGEPGAARIIETNLLSPGFGVEVSSLSQLEPGDVIGWTWASDDTNLSDIGHVTLYMGNGLVTCHAVCALDVDANTFFGTSGWTRHLIHILDYPTLWTSQSGNNMTFMWTTCWTNYVLYSSTNLTAWTKITTKPAIKGITNSLTFSMPASGGIYYRLEMP